jgi:pilus assembly protein CpaE
MKILVASKDQSSCDAIRACIDGGEPRHVLSSVLGDIVQVSAAVEKLRPDVLVLDRHDDEVTPWDAVEKLLHGALAPATILLSKSPGAELLLSAMRAGVREVLPWPAARPALGDAVVRAAQRRGVPPPSAGKGQVLAFLSCKGGAGATFLASNLAYALAQNRPVRVALLDLNLQSGDALLHVSDRAPAVTLADVTRDISRLDESLLAASMVQVLPNFGVLAAPGSPERALDVSADHIDALLDEAALHYDYVIVDANRVLDAVVVRALDRAATIFLVVQLTVPAVRDARRLLSAFDALGYPRDRIQLVVNRFEKGGEIEIKDVEKTVGIPVAWSLPNSFRQVTSSVNQGIPILKLAPKDPVSRALQGMAAGVAKPRKERENWFRDLLHLN